MSLHVTLDEYVLRLPYLKSSILMINCPALSAAIGGQNWMDCSRRFQMMCSINKTHYQMWSNIYLWIWLNFSIHRISTSVFIQIQ